MVKTTALEPVRTTTETLTQMVFESIKAAILDKALPPGGRVTESSLAAQLNVSKTPVREALLRLRHIGLVEATSEGLSVVRPSLEDAREAYEHRVALERMAAQLAAGRAGDDAAAAIRKAAAASLDAARAGNRDGFRTADTEFHTLVAAASSNSRLAEAINESLVLIGVIRTRDVPDLGESVKCGEAHLAIADAIAAGDGRTAAEGMQHHIEHVMGLVIAAADGATDES